MAARAVIFGLGSFGSFLGKALYDEGCEVLGIDHSLDLVNAHKSSLSATAEVDVSDRTALLGLGIATMDLAIVGMGSSVATSILLTQFLSTLTIEQIIAKAYSEEHEQALFSVGATKVIFPERDVALRLARHIVRPNVLDYIPVEPGYSVIELVAPKKFQGKTLEELHLRRNLGLSVLAAESADGQRTMSPPGTFVIEAGQKLTIFGHDDNLARVHNLD